MKIVRESLGFERTGDVKKGLSLGKRERIHQWFNEWAPNIEYEIRDDLSVMCERLYVKKGVKTIPFDLEINNSFEAVNSGFERLINRLYIDGDLLLSENNLEYLSGDTFVGGSLFLRENPINSLEPGLKVMKNLHVKDTNISEIPEGIEVGGMLFVDKKTKVPNKFKHKVR
jgi:hypothetical protein